MTSSQRIAFNTVATYARTVFAMALGLFSGRWVFQSLGSVDYGLMGVVGGLITFIIFLNGVTSSSCARFFALSVGQGDVEETNKWFNTALSIHTILPAILILVGWPIGEWAVTSFLNIPAERLNTALWVFRFSLISAFWGMSTTPYMAMYTAKQKIAELSLWRIANTLINFGFVYWLTSYKGDAWLVYAGYTVAIAVMLGVGQVLRARAIFPECRIHFSRWYEKKRLQQVFSFSGWQLFGSFGSLLRGQGIAILLNRFFSPVSFPQVNASYSVAGQVSSYTQMLSSALLGAFTPEITSTEGRGDRARMIFLSNKASKFGTYLVMLFAVPLILEINLVLTLWLKNPPEQAGGFCSLILFQFLIDRLTYGQMVGVNAVGRIAGYQMMLGSLIILTLPLAWLFLTLGYPAISVGWAIIITTVLVTIGRVIWAKHLTGASPSLWLKQVFMPCISLFLADVCLGYGAIYIWTQLGYEAGFMRVCATTFTTLLGNIVIGWFVILDKPEREFFLRNVYAMKMKLTRITQTRK